MSAEGSAMRSKKHVSVHEADRNFVNQRVAQYRDQTERYLQGDLSEDEFPLRLRNGSRFSAWRLLRVAILYGTLSSQQLRALASISNEFDRGYDT